MIEHNGKKFNKVFDLRTMNPANDPDGMVTEEFLYRAAKNYDPVNIHEAVFWADHFNESRPEPKTGGYIESVIAIGPEFFVSFSLILPWMQELYDSKEFKRCSAEFVILKTGEDKMPYFYAMCPTNMPGSRGLPPLELSGESKQTEHKFAASDLIEKKITFTDTEFEPNFFKTKTKISKIMQNTNLVALAKGQGVNVTDTMTDSEIQSALDAKFTDMKTALTASDEASKKDKHDKAVALVDMAVETGKITPEGDVNFAERKEALVKFAETDYDGCKKVIDGFSKDGSPVTGESGLAGSKVNLKSGNKDAAEGAVTFDDVIGNPEKYMGKYSDDELKKLQAADPKWKNITVGEPEKSGK